MIRRLVREAPLKALAEHCEAELERRGLVRAWKAYIANPDVVLETDWDWVPAMALWLLKQ